MALIKRNDSRFPSIFSDFFDNDDFMGFGNSMLRRQQNIPAVNIRETDKAYDIEMAAPGIPKESINVEVENDMLTISGENRQEQKESDQEGRYTRQEFSYSSFSRSFKLPPNVNAEDVKARCENGVVNITIPKKEEQRNKRRIKL
jgi:HSP20 family protein